MKREEGVLAFLSLVTIVAVVLLFLAQPWVRKVDLWKPTMALSDYETLGGLTPVAKGYGTFQDYNTLHANPIQMADYALSYDPAASEIKANLSGFSDFCADLISNHGFQIEGLEEPAQSDLNLTLTGTDNLMPRAAEAINKWLEAVNVAYALNRKAADKTDDHDWHACSEFICCPPADNGAHREFMKSVWMAKTPEKVEILQQSGLILNEATCELVQTLSKIQKLTRNGEPFELDTPLGAVLIGTERSDVYTNPETLLLIEPGGDDIYYGRVAASLSLDKPFSVLIDLDGNDLYEAGDVDGATQGCGIWGCGFLFDMGGDDWYSAERMAQGFALYGSGILFDATGNDRYELRVSGQSAAHFGLSVLADMQGDDTYRAYAFAQASAGCRAMSFLVDSEGNDAYFVEPYVQEGYELLDYGQFPGVNGNWSQGCGMGVRNAGYDRFSLSGGIAGLLDLDGNDRYTGGIWVMGAGYWSGVGFLLDSAGNDVYDSQYYSQASVAHYGIGILLDGAGDDEHQLIDSEIYAGHGASLSFVWDHGAALLVNDGGNDRYMAAMTAFGVAWAKYDEEGPERQETTYAIFVDTGGDDFYANASAPSFGYGRGGFFVDGDGDDIYGFGTSKNGRETSSFGQFGGVFVDYTAEKQEKPVIDFWEAAKQKYGR